ncbi:MAG: mRNA surveillance protein Pelota, partial [Nitrososphaerales archaeon]
MIVRKINDNVYVVVPEDSDDLLSLRRIVRKDDQITVNTTRVVKQVREFARPDRGERVSVRVVLRVEKVSLDSAVDRLRINGVILNSNNELVPRGVSHSHAIRVGDPLLIEKTIWTELDSTILNKGSTQSFVLISIDRTEVAVGRIAGTHLKMIPNVYSGFSGKMYKMKEENVDSYFNDIIKILLNVKDEDDHIVIFGPGDVKRRFHNYLINNTKVNQQNVRVV